MDNHNSDQNKIFSIQNVFILKFIIEQEQERLNQMSQQTLTLLEVKYREKMWLIETLKSTPKQNPMFASNLVGKLTSYRGGEGS